MHVLGISHHVALLLQDKDFCPQIPPAVNFRPLRFAASPAFCRSAPSRTAFDIRPEIETTAILANPPGLRLVALRPHVLGAPGSCPFFWALTWALQTLPSGVHFREDTNTEFEEVTMFRQVLDLEKPEEKHWIQVL